MVIKNEMIEKISILAKLELSEEEKEMVKEDLKKMIEYFDKLNELDTEGIEPMSHIFSIQNIFREDVVENGDMREEILKNAPERIKDCFKVPNTLQ